MMNCWRKLIALSAALFIFCIVYLLLALMWVGAEYVFEGAVHTSYVDSVVNALLTSLMVARMK